MPLNQNLRKGSHVLWTISIIQDKDPQAQTKAEFYEMVSDVVNTQTINNVTLCLADELQRFRLMIEQGITEGEAIEQCQVMANAWHQDNNVSLEKLKENKQFSILTWEEFLKWPNYAHTIQELEKFYKEDRNFRNDVDGRIRQELKNLKDIAKLSDPVQQTILLKKYLFEECAFQKFAATKQFHYELYKTPMNKAMRRIKNHSDFVPPGFMVEVHFSQFHTSPKKKQAHQIRHDMSALNEKPLAMFSSNGNVFEKASFNSLFNKSSAKYPILTDPQLPASFFASIKSPGQKVAEFIEKAIQLLPPEQQEKAAQELIAFTTQKIIAPYYLNHENTLKT